MNKQLTQATKQYTQEDLQQFDFHGTPIRLLKDEDNKPWFLASDVCAALGYKNVAQTLKSIGSDRSRCIKIYLSSSSGKTQRFDVTLISESGLYALAFRSRKPEASHFQDWITETVIPSIREHGGYVKGQESLPEEYRRWMHNHIQNNLLPALHRIDDMTQYSGFKSKRKAQMDLESAIVTVASRYNLPLELVEELANKGLYVVKDKVNKLV